MKDCLFCNIIKGDIPSAKIFEDEDVYAFSDIRPQAKVHILVVSKAHVADMAHSGALTDKQLSACLRACVRVARECGVEESGYRVVNNCGEDARQTVGHIHFHVLGGERLSERMG